MPNTNKYLKIKLVACFNIQASVQAEWWVQSVQESHYTKKLKSYEKEYMALMIDCLRIALRRDNALNKLLFHNYSGGLKQRNKLTLICLIYLLKS